ncbi:MAG: RNB domain-containing ribonuclease [Acidobacteria bacterium]|nr:RNB domain-containing ribonuclease [Acidobacteriota bacterium]
MHREGYGFVLPDQESLPARLKQSLRGDIFIPPTAIGAAMHGDRVLVEISRLRADGRAEGRIVRVFGRAHPTVVGTFHYGRQNYVRPIDERITRDIIIPMGREYPEQAGRPQAGKSKHRVLGEDVARSREWSDLENAVVDVEMLDWPTATHNPRGRVLEILGYEHDFGVDVEIIIRKFHLPHRFPSEVLEQAQAIDPIIPARELRARRDYRSQPVVTIDGESARDFDDAVFVRRLDHGNYELQIHIADVAHYVTEGSPLDEEARLRGTSVYFPDRSVPMLPLELSTDICSLRPRVDRQVMSCIMEIDRRGEIVGYEINPGVIRSAERMTYTDVNLCLEGDIHARRRFLHLVDCFELMRELEQILNGKRQRRGSIDFDLPEPVIEFDENGLMKSIARSERNIAHRIIEEFMLSANECVAEYLESKGVPSLYRIHEKPDAKRVYDFETIAASFGYSLGVGPLPIARIELKSDRRASYGSGRRPGTIEIPKEINITPRMYQKLTQKIAGKPEERILSFLMLRSLKQARYSEINEGHFALAAPAYTHFTSPIRRYPDLIIHRILKAVLEHSAEHHEGKVAVGRSVAISPAAPGGGRRSKPTRQSSAQSSRSKSGSSGLGGALEAHTGPIPAEELRDIAEDSSQAERRADEAERELMEWKKVKFMQGRVGEDFDGLVVSVTKFGLFVELTDLFVEGLVPLSTLTGDRYTYHENTKQVIGQRTRKTYSLGDHVKVLVDRIDPVEKKIQFAMQEPEKHRSSMRKFHHR